MILKKSLLIATPYFDYLGGTEVEALNTAIYFYDTGLFEQVLIFSPRKIDTIPFNKMFGERKIHSFTYPAFLSSSIINYINRIFLKFGMRYNIAEYCYWKIRSINITTFFVLTYTKSAYFFPIIKAISLSKKIIGKITMGHFDILPQTHINFYKRFENIIVFNKQQQDFWKINYQFKQITALDIMIPNETNLLKVNKIKIQDTKNLVFGFFGRISREKNILDMILLLDFLNNKNKLHCKLIIQGDGILEYIAELKEKVEEFKLTEVVIFNNFLIDPMLTHEFFNKIEVFLVTSIHEGGPITALEAAAAGKIILGYEIGAMYDRFGKFPYFVNQNFEELCNSAMVIINIDKQSITNLSVNIKEHYISHLCNEQKGTHLLEIINK